MLYPLSYPDINYFFKILIIFFLCSWNFCLHALSKNFPHPRRTSALRTCLFLLHPHTQVIWVIAIMHYNLVGCFSFATPCTIPNTNRASWNYLVSATLTRNAIHIISCEINKCLDSIFAARATFIDDAFNIASLSRVMNPVSRQTWLVRLASNQQCRCRLSVNSRVGIPVLLRTKNSLQFWIVSANYTLLLYPAFGLFLTSFYVAKTCVLIGRIWTYDPLRIVQLLFRRATINN